MYKRSKSTIVGASHQPQLYEHASSTTLHCIGAWRGWCEGRACEWRGADAGGCGAGARPPSPPRAAHPGRGR
eukprot:6764366-Pyramimonas_sp.AAC.4